MVAAAHPLSVQIGVDVLKKGGSAVDAAIAVNAALGLLEPMSCGIGGDLFAIVWDAKTQKLYGLNASGRAPRALTADKIKADADGTIDDRTPDLLDGARRRQRLVRDAREVRPPAHGRPARALHQVRARGGGRARDHRVALGFGRAPVQGRSRLRTHLPARGPRPQAKARSSRTPTSPAPTRRSRKAGATPSIAAPSPGTSSPSRRRTAATSRRRTWPRTRRTGSSPSPPTIAACACSSCLRTARASPPSSS